jgi:general secretion pathway protein L
LSTLYIRLPSKAAADIAPHWLSLACPFALVSQGNVPHGSAIERQGMATLSDLSRTIAKAQRVVLLLAASDVALRHMQVPPLSAARLKAALPNLVEDQLINDPSDCVVVADSLSGVSGASAGLRTIAVIQRAWLAILTKTLLAFGARQITALPAQLCLSFPADQPGSVTAAINGWNGAEQNAAIDITLRLSEQDGIGFAIMPALSQPDISTSSAQDTQNVSEDERHESTASVVIQTLCMVVPAATIQLYVPQSAVRAYQEASAQSKSAINKRINVFADNWSHWIAGANVTTLDLMAGLGTATGTKLNWRPWRWPLVLAVAVLVINATALNIDWWRMKNEANSLRTAMVQIYKTAYPKESVIIDPIAQMQQKIAAAKHTAGLPNADDFTAIIAVFGEAWSSVAGGSGNASAIAAIEYREHSLYVRLKSGSEVQAQQMKAALAQRDLLLDLAPEPSGAIVWKIRSAK